jgi:hypothetical protein
MWPSSSRRTSSASIAASLVDASARPSRALRERGARAGWHTIGEPKTGSTLSEVRSRARRRVRGGPGQHPELVAQQDVLEDEVLARAHPGNDACEQEPDEFEHVLSIADLPLARGFAA